MNLSPAEALEARERAELMVDAEAVTRAIDQTAVRVTAALKHGNPLLLCLMHGGLPYCGRLLQRLHFPLELGYAHLTRYQGGTRGGALEWLAKPRQSLAGRQVLLVDDVLSQGETLQTVRDWAAAAGAERVWSTVLVRKERKANEAVAVDFAALRLADRYLCGCGLDYRGYWRNLPAIYALPEDLEDAS